MSVANIIDSDNLIDKKYLPELPPGGPKGDTGPQGDQGPPGNDGPIGPQGPPGTSFSDLQFANFYFTGNAGPFSNQPLPLNGPLGGNLQPPNPTPGITLSGGNTAIISANGTYQINYSANISNLDGDEDLYVIAICLGYGNSPGSIVPYKSSLVSNIMVSNEVNTNVTCLTGCSLLRVDGTPQYVQLLYGPFFGFGIDTATVGGYLSNGSSNFRLPNSSCNLVITQIA